MGLFGPSFATKMITIILWLTMAAKCSTFNKLFSWILDNFFFPHKSSFSSGEGTRCFFFSGKRTRCFYPDYSSYTASNTGIEPIQQAAVYIWASSWVKNAIPIVHFIWIVKQVMCAKIQMNKTSVPTTNRNETHLF